MKKILLFLFPVLLVVACSDEQDYSLDDYYIDIATVENPDNSTAFYLKLDDDTRLWTAATELKYYRPIDGQRVIANFSILSDKEAGSAYDHDIKLNDVYEVLTKDIFKITPATQDSIGNDYIYIRDIWIGSDYLNVRFEFPGGNQMHFINLVTDSLKTYSDGKIHLEFRHNSNGDYPYLNLTGIVSFNLKSLKTNDADQIDIVVHTREFNEPVNGIYNLTYKYGSNSSAEIKRKVSVPEYKALVE